MNAESRARLRAMMIRLAPSTRLPTDTVLELLDALDAAERERDELRAWKAMYDQSNMSPLERRLRDALDAAEARVATLEQALASELKDHNAALFRCDAAERRIEVLERVEQLAIRLGRDAMVAHLDTAEQERDAARREAMMWMQIAASDEKRADAAERRANVLTMAVRRLKQDCPVQACEGDWDMVNAALEKPLGSLPG